MTEEESLARVESVVQRQPVDGQLALHHMANSLRLLAQLFFDEMDVIRESIHEKGMAFRQWLRNKLRIDTVSVARTAAGLLSKTSTAYVQPAVLDAALIFNDIPFDSRPPGPPQPKFSLNDLETILTTDEVAEGVVQAYTLRSRPWARLPPKRVKTPADEDGTFNFQLYNRPVAMSMMDEDDEKRSLTSASRYADSDQAILDIQAQLQLLTRQLSLLTKVRSTASPIPSPLPLTPCVQTTQQMSPTSSDDGVCLPGISDEEEAPEVAASLTTPPLVIPPSHIPPPPPPPPVDFLRASKTLPRSESLGSLPVANALTNVSVPTTSSASNVSQGVVRPSSDQLKAVKLKKTSGPKSPGGTPIPRRLLSSKSSDDDTSNRDDQGAFFAKALMKKFKNVRPSLSLEDVVPEASEEWDDSSTPSANAS